MKTLSPFHAVLQPGFTLQAAVAQFNSLHAAVDDFNAVQEATRAVMGPPAGALRAMAPLFQPGLYGQVALEDQAALCRAVGAWTAPTEALREALWPAPLATSEYAESLLAALVRGR